MKDAELREEYQIILCWDVTVSSTFNARLLHLLLMRKIFKNETRGHKERLFPYIFVFVVALSDNT